MRPARCAAALLHSVVKQEASKKQVDVPFDGAHESPHDGSFDGHRQVPVYGDIEVARKVALALQCLLRRHLSGVLTGWQWETISQLAVSTKPDTKATWLLTLTLTGRTDGLKLNMTGRSYTLRVKVTFI